MIAPPAAPTSSTPEADVAVSKSAAAPRVPLADWQERRDWIFAEVRRKFRPFVDDEARWLTPPGLTPQPDARVFVQVALAYLHGTAADRALAAKLLLSPPVLAKVAEGCAFVPEYLVTLLHAAGPLVPADVRERITAAIAPGLLSYARRDLRHHGYNDNHVTLATAHLVLTGELTGQPEAVEEGRANLLNFRDTFLRRGFMHETNDCYIPHTLYSLAAVAEWARDPEIRALARACEERVWVDWSGHWHPELARKPGPSARDYTRGRLHPLTVNTALWAILGDDFGQPVYPPEDSFADALPEEHRFDFDGNPHDGAWDCGFLTWMAAHPFHPPRACAELFVRRTYPHIIQGTHEMGHFAESAFRFRPDATGGPGTPEWRIHPGVMPFAAREFYTYQYQEADWAMGTASQRMLGRSPNNNWSVSWRKSAPLRRTADQGLLFSSFTVNDKPCTANHDFTLDPADPFSKNSESVEHWSDNGRYAAVQHERTALMLYRPRMVDSHAITSLATSLILPLHFGNSIDRIDLGDETLTNFNTTSPHLTDLFIQDGPLYIALRPLIPLTLPADFRVKVELGVFWVLFHFYTYRGPATALEEIDLSRMGGGFLCEVATTSDFPTLEAFKSWFRQAQILDETEFFMRQVRYHRPGLDLALRWDVWSDNIMYRMLNGREYPTPKFASTSLNPESVPWLTGDVSALDHFDWARRQAARPLQHWPAAALCPPPKIRPLHPGPLSVTPTK